MVIKNEHNIPKSELEEIVSLTRDCKKDNAFENCPPLYRTHNRHYMSQSGLKETGQAYCAYCIRETLMAYGERRLLVWRNALIRMEERHIISTQEGTKLVCRKTLMHINKGKVPNRRRMTLYYYSHFRRVSLMMPPKAISLK